MTPRRGGCCFLWFLPVTPSSWSQILEGLFALTQLNSKALNIVSCFQNYRIRRKPMQTLMVCLWKTHSLTLILFCGKPTKCNWDSDLTCPPTPACPWGGTEIWRLSLWGVGTVHKRRGEESARSWLWGGGVRWANHQGGPGRDTSRVWRHHGRVLFECCPSKSFN